MANPGEYLQRRVAELETRVTFLEAYLRAIFAFFGLFGRRRHAPAEVADLIEAFRRQRDAQPETPPTETSPTPSEGTV